jgi:mevalonate kinase
LTSEISVEKAVKLASHSLMKNIIYKRNQHHILAKTTGSGFKFHGFEILITADSNKEWYVPGDRGMI